MSDIVGLFGGVIMLQMVVKTKLASCDRSSLRSANDKIANCTCGNAHPTLSYSLYGLFENAIPSFHQLAIAPDPLSGGLRTDALPSERLPKRPPTSKLFLIPSTLLLTTTISSPIPALTPYSPVLTITSPALSTGPLFPAEGLSLAGRLSVDLLRALEKLWWRG